MTDAFVLHSKALRYQHHSGKWNRIRAEWPGSARNGTVKQREPFGPKVEKRLMSMTESCRWVMQCRLRAQRPRASNKGLRPCPLRTEISPVSLNLLMMLCTVDDEICKAFAIWRRRTFFFTHNLFTHSFTDWRVSAHLYFWETLPL